MRHKPHVRQHEPVFPGGSQQHHHAPAGAESFHDQRWARTLDTRVWFGALYLQDQWTLNRFTLNGALRYDHAQSRYGDHMRRRRRERTLRSDPDRRRVQRPAPMVHRAEQRRQLQRHYSALGSCVGRVRKRQDVNQVEHGQVSRGGDHRRAVRRASTRRERTSRACREDGRTTMETASPTAASSTSQRLAIWATPASRSPATPRTDTDAIRSRSMRRG